MHEVSTISPWAHKSPIVPLFYGQFFQHGLSFFADQQYFKGYAHAQRKTQAENSTEVEKSEY